MTVRTKTSSIDVIEHEVTMLLRRAESTQTALGGLDRSAYLLLGALEMRGPLAVTALSQLFHLDLSTASRQAAALEAKGLANRLRDPGDARVSVLSITSSGQEAFRVAREARRALFEEILGDWPEADRERFGLYLEKLNQAITARRAARPDGVTSGEASS